MNNIGLIFQQSGIIGYLLFSLFILEGGICLYRIYIIWFQYNQWEIFLLNQFSGNKELLLKFLEDEEQSFYHLDLPFFRFLSLLRQIGQIAPLLGMLGTILGIIISLKALDVQDNVNLLLGLSRSLITTVMGIVISVIAIISYHVFYYQHKIFVKRIKQKILYGK